MRKIILWCHLAARIKGGYRVGQPSGGALLVYTGLSLALGRLRGWRAKRRGRAPEVEDV